MSPLTIICLAFIGGFVDTATFIGAYGIFSAHITGNFILFGVALSEGLQLQDYANLLVFPIFIIAVGFGAFIYNLHTNKITSTAAILLIEAIIILIVSMIDYFFHDHVPKIIFGLTLVVPMGMQNFLHHYSKGPMTTVMTGNIVHWSVSTISNLLSLSPLILLDTERIRGAVIMSFGFGCIISGVVTTRIGITSCAIPAVILLLLVMTEIIYKKKL